MARQSIHFVLTEIFRVQEQNKGLGYPSMPEVHHLVTELRGKQEARPAAKMVFQRIGWTVLGMRTALAVTLTVPVAE